MEDMSDLTQAPGLAADANANADAEGAPAGAGRSESGRNGNSRATAGAAGGVQSIERAFDLLEMLADGDGALGLSELAAVSGLPLPTVHRLMRTLVNRGYVRQEASRRYTL